METLTLDNSFAFLAPEIVSDVIDQIAGRRRFTSDHLKLSQLEGKIEPEELPENAWIYTHQSMQTIQVTNHDFIRFSRISHRLYGGEISLQLLMDCASDKNGVEKVKKALDAVKPRFDEMKIFKRDNLKQPYLDFIGRVLQSPIFEGLKTRKCPFDLKPRWIDVDITEETARQLAEKFEMVPIRIESSDNGHFTFWKQEQSSATSEMTVEILLELRNYYGIFTWRAIVCLQKCNGKSLEEEFGMNMNMIDPRAFLLNPAIVYDASTLALLHQTASNPSQQLVGGGKMLGNNSFRISDILSSSKASSEDKADTSGENDTLEGSDLRSPSNESSERLRSESPNSTCESGSGSGGKKARKARTIFTDKQLQELENTFEKQKYLSVQDRMELAKRLGLSDTQVKTWYQNRRTKWKRQSAVGMEFLNDATNVSAVQNLLRTPYWSNYFQTNPQALFAQQRLCAPGAGFGIPGGTPLIPGLHGLDPSAQIPMLFPAGLAASIAPGLAASPICSTAMSKISPSLDFTLMSKENTETSSPSPPAPPISPKSD